MTRRRTVLPYVIVLAITGVLYFFAMKIERGSAGARIGPDVWPKAILVLAMIACVYEIAKNLLFGKRDGDLEGVLGSVLKEMPADAAESAAEEVKYPRLLWAGIAATIAYVPLIEVLGFFLCTTIYLGVFMWLGQYRRLGVIVATSVIGSLAFMFVFMKIVYVSLPLGAEPFSQVSFLLMRLMAIK